MKKSILILIAIMILFVPSCQREFSQPQEGDVLSGQPIYNFGKAVYIPLSDDWQIPAVRENAENINIIAEKYNLPADLIAAICSDWGSCGPDADVIGDLLFIWVDGYPDQEKALQYAVYMVGQGINDQNYTEKIHTVFLHDPQHPGPKFVHTDGVNFGFAQPTRLSGSWPESVWRWETEINSVSLENSIPANLLAALCLVEGCDETRVSEQGAVGLLQIMPSDGKATEYVTREGVQIFSERPSTAQFQVGLFNLDFGAGMLAKLVGDYSLISILGTYGEDESFGEMYHLEYALVAYGPGGIGSDYMNRVFQVFVEYSK